MSTPNILSALAVPFPLHEIKWKPQTKPNAKGYSTVVAYVDARAVIDRLNNVCGTHWGATFRVINPDPKHFVVECHLRVWETVRSDVGTGSDIEAEKGGYSDALKRAAVHYGINRQMYDFPRVMARMEGNYLTEEARRELVKLTELVMKGSQKLPRFNSLMVFDYEPLEVPLDPKEAIISELRALWREAVSRGVDISDIEPGKIPEMSLEELQALLGRLRAGTHEMAG